MRGCVVCGWYYAGPSAGGLCPACREEQRMEPVRGQVMVPFAETLDVHEHAARDWDVSP